MVTFDADGLVADSRRAAPEEPGWIREPVVPIECPRIWATNASSPATIHAGAEGPEISHAPLRSPTVKLFRSNHAIRRAVSIPRNEHAMSKVVAIMSMSLDGSVADLNDGVAEVFDWYFTSGDVEIHTGGSDPMTFDSSTASPARQSSLATRR